MATVELLRKRRAEVQQADDARNSLLDDLLQKVDDMKKTMDRNAFIMVLIDGDCMTFLNELVKRGSSGGDEAAKLLRRAVFEYLRYDEDFKHDYKIVIRVYANIRGLSKTYADKGILPNTTAFHEFVHGFNKANPLCDFIDAGNHKEAADTKLKETLSLYVYNVHCKQILFGASADNGYASFLSSFFLDTDVSSRLRLLKGPPWSFEFKNILSKFRWTEFSNVFNNEFISNESTLQHNTWRRSQDVEHLRTSGQISSTALENPAVPWRPSAWGAMQTGNVSANGTSMAASKPVLPMSEARGAGADDHTDGRAPIFLRNSKASTYLDLLDLCQLESRLPLGEL